LLRRQAEKMEQEERAPGKGKKSKVRMRGARGCSTPCAARRCTLRCLHSTWQHGQHMLLQERDRA